ncbi:MAG TPA: hypothetical protein VLF18_13650 [Tahibacter sp.]|uniref:hypothetical protein n=1 Tax=Tahibacter sp. TaxID=2056211 RepID=UPI002C3AE33B|nr:hypothetical protein [Tahibacter sp.]HSX61239.1 hypothetical protein [Tahibacter sp.]
MSHSRWPARALLSIGAAFATFAAADPYRPTHDAEVIETLPRAAARGGDAATRTLREWHARDPSNLDVALRLAQTQIAAARASADPRLWGQAQAALAPWWNLDAAPVPVLLARAAIRQNRHDFDAAEIDLLRAVAQQPQQAQAWLDLASLQQATGDLAGAAQSCERVVATGASTVGIICRASVDALMGEATAGYAAVADAVAQGRLADQPPAVRVWAATLLAEIAERRGHGEDAERWYRQSLSLDPTDGYALAAYADFLLDRGRAADVATLIAPDSAIDGLLLRRVQADRALDARAAQAGAATLAARFDALRARGDRVHRREESRFRLALARDPDAALELALQNWAVQKEPLDARIALEAAHAARQPQAAADIARWIHASGLEDVRLVPLLAGVRAP